MRFNFFELPDQPDCNGSVDPSESFLFSYSMATKRYSRKTRKTRKIRKTQKVGGCPEDYLNCPKCEGFCTLHLVRGNKYRCEECHKDVIIKN